MKALEEMKRIALDAIREINWENYHDEEDESKGYFKLGQVFFSQLEWIKENLEQNDSTDELIDYITEIQNACEVFNILDDLINEEASQ